MEVFQSSFPPLLLDFLSRIHIDSESALRCVAGHFAGESVLSSLVMIKSFFSLLIGCNYLFLYIVTIPLK